jgi:hypothetical protein
VSPAGRVGSLDDPDKILTRVGDVLIGPGEELYVAQPQDGNVRVYDAGGALTGKVGRSGKGPGEFARLTYLGLRSDTLYATDNGLGRVSFFSGDGRFLRSRQWTTALRSERSPDRVWMMYGETVPQRFLPDGTALVEVEAFEIFGMDSQQRDPIRSLGEWPHPFLRVDTTGQAIDTLSQERREKRLFRVDQRGVTLYFPTPFEDAPLAALMRDGSGVVVVDRPVATRKRDATFGVTLVSPAGDTVFSRTFAYEPRPVPDEVVRRTAEGLAPARRNGPDPAAIEASLRANDLVPSTLPPVTGLTVGQDGSIWLRREEVAGDSMLWNVLDRTGALRGALRLPARDSVAAARGDLVAAVYADELDVPYVVTYRLER